MPVGFRYAEEKDLPAIVATYNSTIPSRLVTADLEAVTVEDKKAWFDKHTRDHRPLLIVLYQGEYAGWMSFNSFYGRPAYDGTVEISIYLEEKLRAKGIGKACVARAIVEAKVVKAHTLLGFIFGHNTPSLKLFQTFGFNQWAFLPGIAEMDGIMRDLVILGKKLQG